MTVIPNLTRGARPYGVIENVVTHAAYRRQGLGRAVVPKALDVSWKRGRYKVTLNSGTGEAAAHAFYEAIGFKRNAKQAFVAHPV